MYTGKDLGFDDIEITTTLAILAFCFKGNLYSILYVCGGSNRHNPDLYTKVWIESCPYNYITVSGAIVLLG